MSKSNPLKARLPRGFADRPAADLAATHRMLEAIRETYELYGFEALLRWDRPGHGPVSPAVFVPVAEAMGLHRELDTWAMRAACCARRRGRARRWW